MTAAERNTLDLVIGMLHRLEGKVDGIDTRLRNVEISVATESGAAAAREEGRNLTTDAKLLTLQHWSVLSAALGVLVALAAYLTGIIR